MRKRCMTLLAFCAAVSAAYGANYYLKSGATDFSVATSYTLENASGTDATTPPTSNDRVFVPAGTYAIAGDSASFTTLSGVKRVSPNDGAILEFTIDDNDTRTFDAPINWNGGERYDKNLIRCYGKVVKMGGGTLILAACGKTKSNDGGFRQDYFTQIELQQGTLKLPQYADGAMYFGDIAMSNGTTLVTCGDLNNSNNGVPTFVRTINGYGIVTNESGRSAGQIFTPYGQDAVRASEFHGKICHPVRHWLQGRFVQYGHETGITQPLTVQYNYGHLNDGYDRGVYSFEDVALLGSHGTIQFYSFGGGIHYFGGADAVMAKAVNLYSYNHPAFVDAGWHGGLRCTGGWFVSGNDANNTVQKWLVLTGSNAVPCTIEGSFVESSYSGTSWASAIPYTIVVQKLGSGTWRFKGNRNHGGGFAIEEGTLQFDSIAEKGVTSSLGLSTNLTEIGSTKTPVSADYAFLLGSTKADAPHAVFEFTGANSCESSTRPLVLKGKGGSIRASGADGARLGFGGVSALAAGETTLVLDGTNTKNNVASGIIDGNGTVSVIKDGDGEWSLSGTNTFSGDLHVKAGVLTVLGNKYRWFRFTIRELGNRGNQLQCRQLALYDANGIRQNICLEVKEPVLSADANKYWPDSAWQSLAPGSFAFGSDKFRLSKTWDTTTWSYKYVDQLFSDIGNTANAGTPRFDGGTSYGKEFDTSFYASSGTDILNLRRDNSDSWIPLVMRLTNGTPEIVSYDIESMWHSGGTNNWPKVASMEASVDGIYWELVETNALGEVVSEHDYDFSIPLGSANPGVNAGNSNRWFSDGTKQVNWNPETGTTPRPGAGFPMRSHADIPPPLQNVRSVSVSAGATLKTDAGVVIRSLRVDSAGAGTIDGFTFAENGTIDVAIAAVPQTGIALPGTYVNCTGLGNVARWGLKVDGTPSRRYRVKVRDGSIYLVPRGINVSFK